MKPPSYRGHLAWTVDQLAQWHGCHCRPYGYGTTRLPTANVHSVRTNGSPWNIPLDGDGGPLMRPGTPTNCGAAPQDTNNTPKQVALQLQRCR